MDVELFFIVSFKRERQYYYYVTDYRYRLPYSSSHAKPVARATSHASDTLRRNPSSVVSSIHTSLPVSLAQFSAAKSNALSRFGKRFVASGSDRVAAAATRNRRVQKTSAET